MAARTRPNLNPFRECRNCGGEFQPSRSDALHCSLRCTKQASAKRHPRKNRQRGSPRYYESQKLAAENLRRCSGCEKILPVDSFWKSQPGKRLSKCADCTTAKQRTSRKKDTNAPKIRERSLRWRLAHPQLSKERIAACVKANPEPSREARRRRRVFQSQNGVFVVTQRELCRLLIRQRGCCYLCNLPIIDKELDHIIPVSKGGRHSIGNLGWACHKCNRSKSNKMLSQFRFGGKNERSSPSNHVVPKRFGIDETRHCVSA